MQKVAMILSLALLTAAAACESNSEGTMKDPATVQPPSEALPDSTAIVNDSLIVPDSTKHNR
jgi:hypothetical protein